MTDHGFELPGELPAAQRSNTSTRLEHLVTAAEAQLTELDVSADPVPLSLRGTALRSSRLATDLLIAAEEHAGPCGSAARRLAITLMCASNRAMAMWSKRIGRWPIDAVLSDPRDDRPA